MKRRMMFLALGALLVACPAAAQWHASTGVSAWYEDAPLPGELLFAPSAALDGTRLALVAGATLTGPMSDLSYLHGRVAGAWLFDAWKRAPLELKVNASLQTGELQPDIGLVRAEGRLHFAGTAGGGWMAVATEQVRGIEGGLNTPLIGFGLWARKSGFTLSLDLQQRAGVSQRTTYVLTSSPEESLDTFVPVTTNRVPASALTSTRAIVRWQGGPLELESIGGVTLSLLGDPKRWAQASAALHLTGDLAMFAVVGRPDPQLYLTEPPGYPSATVGMRLSKWRSPWLDSPLPARAAATKWRAERLRADTWTLQVRAPGARMVEVMGDFTAWEPLNLQHQGGDRWEVVVMLEPGAHQVNLRVDGGAWMPPPGTPTATDAYGGVTGVLVAE